MHGDGRKVNPAIGAEGRQVAREAEPILPESLDYY